MNFKNFAAKKSSAKNVASSKDTDIFLKSSCNLPAAKTHNSISCFELVVFSERCGKFTKYVRRYSAYFQIEIFNLGLNDSHMALRP